MLMAKGYAGVYVLQGGLFAWEEAGFPVEKSRL
jgi:rhodanese-related sulfurtransferase